MKASVSKTFTFEAAHHLPNHDGKCREPHGHSYRVVVTCEGNIRGVTYRGSSTRAGVDDPKRGMVVDFADIKTVWEQELKPLLDHKDLNESLLDLVPETTAECLAYFICSMYRHSSSKIPIKQVEVWETTTSCAVVLAQEVWANGD